MEFLCNYCKVLISSVDELSDHCLTHDHVLSTISDEEMPWKYRCFPNGFDARYSVLCQRFEATGQCENYCEMAHGKEEQMEWFNRVIYRGRKLFKRHELDMEEKQYFKVFLEKHFTPPQETAYRDFHDVDFSVCPELTIIVPENCSMMEWTFIVLTQADLRGIALGPGSDKDHFHLSYLASTPSDGDESPIDLEEQCREWRNSENLRAGSECIYTCKVKFVKPSRGTFSQIVEFHFSDRPAVVKKIMIDVVSDDDFERLCQARETVESFAEMYSSGNVTIIPLKSKHYFTDDDQETLSDFYPLPSSCDFLTPAVLGACKIRRNYRTRQHQLLYMEEMVQQQLISRCSCVVQVRVQVDEYGRLSAHAKLPHALLEDFDETYLVLYNCDTVLLAPLETKGEKNRKVYEASIIHKRKCSVWMKLSEACLIDLKLTPDSTFNAQIQFQLNGLPFCEMHIAVDRIKSLPLIFPEVGIAPVDPWKTSRASFLIDPYLNFVQNRAFLTITAPLFVKLPPVLVAGAFGTGKSTILFDAAKAALQDPRNRVLICTHSNRTSLPMDAEVFHTSTAADYYITEYFHPYVALGHVEATPLRLYHYTQNVSGVHPMVQSYCPMYDTTNRQTFAMPEREEVLQYRIVVSNYRTSRHLFEIGLGEGAFTHIFIDDAAQALECEAIIPLGLATENTRIVIAGDLLQRPARVYSTLALDCSFDKSLLQRLWDLYPEDFPCKFLLTQNYSSHPEIVKFASATLYGNRVSAEGNQRAHWIYHPLTWFHVNADNDADDVASATGFYNTKEVNVIVKRIIEVRRSWPAAWGPRNDNDIGVVTPYYDQVVEIRRALRKCSLGDIFVGKLSSIEGKHFRVLFLSTVRGHRTCCPSWVRSTSSHCYEPDCQLLPDQNFLRSALTRAKSLIAVVGNANVSYKFETNRNLWKKFLSVCHKKRSVHQTNLGLTDYWHAKESRTKFTSARSPSPEVSVLQHTAEENCSETETPLTADSFHEPPRELERETPETSFQSEDSGTLPQEKEQQPQLVQGNCSTTQTPLTENSHFGSIAGVFDTETRETSFQSEGCVPFPPEKVLQQQLVPLTENPYFGSIAGVRETETSEASFQSEDFVAFPQQKGAQPQLVLDDCSRTRVPLAENHFFGSDIALETEIWGCLERRVMGFVTPPPKTVLRPQFSQGSFNMSETPLTENTSFGLSRELESETSETAFKLEGFETSTPKKVLKQHLSQGRCSTTETPLTDNSSFGSSKDLETGTSESTSQIADSETPEIGTAQNARSTQKSLRDKVISLALAAPQRTNVQTFINSKKMLDESCRTILQYEGIKAADEFRELVRSIRADCGCRDDSEWCNLEAKTQWNLSVYY